MKSFNESFNEEDEEELLLLVLKSKLKRQYEKLLKQVPESAVSTSFSSTQSQYRFGAPTSTPNIDHIKASVKSSSALGFSFTGTSNDGCFFPSLTGPSRKSYACSCLPVSPSLSKISSGCSLRQSASFSSLHPPSSPLTSPSAQQTVVKVLRNHSVRRVSVQWKQDDKGIFQTLKPKFAAPSQKNCFAHELKRHRSGHCASNFMKILRMSENELLSSTSQLTKNYLILSLIGEGGSGKVFAAEVLIANSKSGLKVGDKVAIKTFVRHKDSEYLKDSFLDFSFLSLLQDFRDDQLCPVPALFDVIYSTQQFQGCIQAAADKSVSGKQLPLLSIVTSLMDGTKGRFLEPNEPEFDEVWDTMQLQLFSDCEIFQLIYIQLVLMWKSNCKIFDLMLNSQLRGDNMGFQCIHDSSEVSGLAFQSSSSSLIFFPTPCNVLFFIDFGQGSHPSLFELYEQSLIGNPMVSSCLEDDGMRRYWPFDRLYCAFQPKTELSKKVFTWASNVSISSKTSARKALDELFTLFSCFAVENNNDILKCCVKFEV